MTNYSVLMSVYYKEKPNWLYQSMNSIYNQSVPTDDFVLVCDGTLNDRLDKVINKMQKKFGSRLQVHRLKRNHGLGYALNFGMQFCKNNLVARMDSDDISKSDRCELELEQFKKNPELSIVSGTVAEFEGNINNVISFRSVPEKNMDIIKFAHKRNPFNHPCVMYKKNKVLEAGGYRDFYLLEDYFLWIRMLYKGNKGYNLSQTLLWMRSGPDMYKRRGGIKYIASQIRLLVYMHNIKFIDKKDLCISVLLRTLSGMAPNNVRKLVFNKILRESNYDYKK